MTRDLAQLRTAAATAAALVDLEPGLTWADALFDGIGFSRPADPDRQLLDAVLAQYPQLEEHLARVPARLQVEWLSRILGIPRLPVVPDRIVAHATVDPKAAPVVMAAGTLLRGGKDAAGAERRYATKDALTAHGAALLGVRSTVAGPTSGTVADAPPWPLRPSAGTAAAHMLTIGCHELGFSGGTMTVRLSFTGGQSTQLQHATWHHLLPDGTEAVAAASGHTGASLSIVLTGGCGVPGQQPWVQARIPADRTVPTGFQFTSIKVEVTERSGLRPDAACYNDGLVDVTKEFQPFGAVAHRGDAFYLRSDEAFSKRLGKLTVKLELMSSGSGVLTEVVWGTGMSAYTKNQVLHNVDSYYAYAEEEEQEVPDHVVEILEQLELLTAEQGDPRVAWQRRVDDDWQTFYSQQDSLGSVPTQTLGGNLCSEPFAVAGVTGHHIRAFLAEGDFGWNAYTEAVAQFATDTVAKKAGITMPTPPAPAVVSQVSLSYTTVPVDAVSVIARNGWSVRDKPASTAVFRPFATTVSDTGDTGMVAIGLDLKDVSLGSSVSMYVEIDSAASCGTVQDPDARWEYWNGSGWSAALNVDGTRLLRESGILRVIAAADWASGCVDVDAATGRWIRIVTRAPERLGTILSLSPDAVQADYRSTAVAPHLDPTPATPLPAGAIKGPFTAIPGIKKVGNLAGVKGRGPELDDEYRRRAAARTRHRGRAISAWDYEHHVAIGFPEVAAVRCLPHTGADGNRKVGSVGVVIVPDRPGEPAPRPSVSLAGRITDQLVAMTPIHARPVVLCPLYVPVFVTASVELRPGVAALTGRQAVESALAAWLHPATTLPVRFGRSLYLSSLQAFLEQLPLVDSVTASSMRTSAGGQAVERVEVDACRGLFCSSGDHNLSVQEQL